MKIFINDIPTRIICVNDLIDLKIFDHIVDATEALTTSTMVGDVLIQNATFKLIDRLINEYKDNKPAKIESLSFTVENYQNVKLMLKRNFTIIKAAGGLVVKDGKVLMIHRLGKWDLPKGKLEKNESPKKGAVREVQEECNVNVDLQDKICATWHTYKRNGKRILKRTNWYKMICTDDTKMVPQLEEDITEIKWMDWHEARVALYNSYPSIRDVFKKYFALMN